MKKGNIEENYLGSGYQDQSRTPDKAILLILSLSGIVNNSNEIRTITHKLDKYIETGDMNETRV